MDDFNVSSLHESKNEWGARLLTILTPLIIEGFKSIFDESLKMCKDNNEMDKYLMTFQNFITRIPKWNATMIETERARIVEKSCCNYLEELVTCVHIIQLKLLTAMRSGQKQKKIDVNIPKLSDFIHKAYINTARKVYKNVYLFELEIAPLQIQKNNRELEVIVQECILITIRDSIPVESILRAYMDESVEEVIVEEVKEQIVDDPAAKKPLNHEDVINAVSAPSLKFNDVDMARDINNIESVIQAPKDLDTLQKISEMKALERQIEEDLDEDNVKLTIFDQNLTLSDLDVQDINPPKIELNENLITEFEELN